MHYRDYNAHYKLTDTTNRAPTWADTWSAYRKPRIDEGGLRSLLVGVLIASAIYLLVL